MLEKLKQILAQNKGISGYKITETKTESNELFFIKKNVDMDRAKNVHYFNVTVYKNMEEGDKKYTGSFSANIYPTMNDKEIEKAIEDAAFAAQYAKNPYYPLVKPAASYGKMEASNFSKENLPYWMNEITKAIYKKDQYEKGGVNSCEVFLNKVYTHIVNSEGVDVEAVDYNSMVEFITTWKETGEEIELYRCLNFSDLEAESVTQEVEEMTQNCKQKAVAQSTPAIGNASVLLTGSAVKEFFCFYYDKSCADAVYEERSTWKVGEKVQGEEVKGDLVTMTLDPFMKNSTRSRAFDEDGFALKPIVLIEKGTLQKYMASSRYAHYLNVEPTGNIRNIRVEGGSKSIEEIKKHPYLETIAFSDFTVDTLTGDFCGEIRLAMYFDGEKTRPVTGGSISGNINELQKEMFLSKELQKENNFEGPKTIELLNVTVASVE